MADEIQPPDAPAHLDAQPADANPATTQVAARFDRTDWWSFAVTTALALSVYLFTLAPNVTLEFSGILSTGAMYAGVPHPPGYPLWTIYSWLFIKLIPFSNIAWRVAVGSAVAAAVTCGLTAMMVSSGGKIFLPAIPDDARMTIREQRSLRIVCGCVAGLVLAFNGAVWGKAVIADIWALSLLLFVGVLCLLMRWMFQTQRRRFLYGAFFLFGLLLTNSQEIIVALPGLVCAVMLADGKLGRDVSFFALPLAVLGTILNQYSPIWTVFLTELNWPMLGTLLAVVLAGIALAIKTRRVGTEWKAALLCGLIFWLGLALYFYAPVASMTNPPVNWGYPRTAEGFFHVISRGQYSHVQPTEDFVLFARQTWWFVLATGREFGWLYLVFAALPFGLIRRLPSAARRWLLALSALFLCTGLLQLAMLNPPADLRRLDHFRYYFAAPYVVLAVWLGLGLMMVGARMTRPVKKTSP